MLIRFRDPDKALATIMISSRRWEEYNRLILIVCAFFFFSWKCEVSLERCITYREWEWGWRRNRKKHNRNYLQQVMHINMTQEKYGKGFRRIIAICDASWCYFPRNWHFGKVYTVPLPKRNVVVKRDRCSWFFSQQLETFSSTVP